MQSKFQGDCNNNDVTMKEILTIVQVDRAVQIVASPTIVEMTDRSMTTTESRRKGK